MRRVFVSRCWAAAGGPSDDVVRDATIEEMSQAVFSASPLGALGGYIIRPTQLSSVSADSAVQCSAAQSSEYRLVPCSTETGELGRHSKVTEEEAKARRLHSGLK
jgi:hypothetical protein